MKNSSVAIQMAMARTTMNVMQKACKASVTRIHNMIGCFFGLFEIQPGKIFIHQTEKVLKYLIKFLIADAILFIHAVQNFPGQQAIQPSTVMQSYFISINSFMQAKLLIIGFDQFLNKW